MYISTQIDNKYELKNQNKKKKLIKTTSKFTHIFNVSLNKVNKHINQETLMTQCSHEKQFMATSL